MSTRASPFHILLAIDGSEHAHAALQLVRELPLRETDSVEVLSVMIPRHASNYWAIEALTRQSVDALADSEALVRAEIITGDPAEEILRRASKAHPDLIVMGAKGLRATLGFLLGGVAQQVLEHAEQPVMVVHAPYQGLRRVLVGVDESEFTVRCLEYLGNRFPCPPEASCTLLHVLPPTPSPERMLQAWASYPGEDIYIPQISEEERAAMEKQAAAEEAQGEALLRDLRARLQKDISTESVLLRGDAATELINYARRNDSDLIVTAHRGESGIARWLLGSVARKIAYHAPHAALIVK